MSPLTFRNSKLHGTMINPDFTMLYANKASKINLDCQNLVSVLLKMLKIPGKVKPLYQYEIQMYNSRKKCTLPI